MAASTSLETSHNRISLTSSTGHGHVHGTITVEQTNREAAQGIGQGDLPVRRIGDRDADPFFRFTCSAGLDHPEEDVVAEVGPEGSRPIGRPQALAAKLSG